MSRPRIVHLTSLDQLRARAAAWDDLWWRSEVTMPTTRAELVAQWLEQFAPQAGFHALVVEDQGQLLAALPLVHRTLGRVVDAGELPSNQWSVGGELLLDPAAELDTVLDALVAGMRELPWSLIRLDELALDAPRWKALLGAIARAALAADRQQQLQIGRIAIDHDWDAYKKRWSRKHRQGMARSARRLAEKGDVQFRMVGQLAPEQVEPCLRRGFEVEDRSWKGRRGTSVLRVPRMFDFFLRQAERLAGWGHLQLAFLELSGRPIAFSYGLAAKGVYRSIKVGYDAEYAAYGPGQLLRYYTLKRLFGEPRWRAVDYIPPTAAHGKWRPSFYTVSRLVIAPRGLLGRMAVHAYKSWWPLLRQLSGNSGGPGADVPTYTAR